MIRNGEKEFTVLALTPAYKKCITDDVTSCLEAAVLEVDRTRLY
jgi:hypothetical protein